MLYHLYIVQRFKWKGKEEGGKNKEHVEETCSPSLQMSLWTRPSALTTYNCEWEQKVSTKAPVEPSFHDGVAVVLGGPMVQELFHCSTLLSVLFRNVPLLHLIGASQVNILQALDLPGKNKNK